MQLSMRQLFLLASIIISLGALTAPASKLFAADNAPTILDYPQEWWTTIPRDQASSWEILPQDAAPGEVILSKRTALAVFSNLAATPFVFDGEFYASIEGVWQMMKYPDPDDATDPRHQIAGYPYTRAQVRELSMWESKEAGDVANKLMQENKIDFVSYRGKRFNYKDMNWGSRLHYELILAAMEAKLDQNAGVRELLYRTRGLTLVPDHKIKDTSPASYFYNNMWMKLRERLVNQINQGDDE
jgi:predicted NAD-dependent protein-ADP-ribosyltransferase YbiA (DUF1768 family)